MLLFSFRGKIRLINFIGLSSTLFCVCLARVGESHDVDTMIHIGSLIEKKLREQGRTVTWFATALHCDRTNVYKIFQKSSIDSSMLYRISCILGYDFFSEYTQSFDKGVAKKSTNS